MLERKNIIFKQVINLKCIILKLQSDILNSTVETDSVALWGEQIKLLLCFPKTISVLIVSYWAPADADGSRSFDIEVHELQFFCPIALEVFTCNYC